MGAWIEIGRQIYPSNVSFVAPVWGRGLKSEKIENDLKKVESPPYGGVD